MSERDHTAIRLVGSVSSERTVGTGFSGTLAVLETEAQRRRATEDTATTHPLTGNRYARESMPLLRRRWLTKGTRQVREVWRQTMS